MYEKTPDTPKSEKRLVSAGVWVSQKNIDKNVAFRANLYASLVFSQGVSQMRRRRACAFLPEPLPFSHTRSMAACIENGAARDGRFSRDSMGLG